MKKKVIITLIIIVVVIVDLTALLYPTISNYINSHSESRAVASYIDDVANMSDAKKQAILKAAHEYNKELLTKADRYTFTKEETAQYNRLLNIGNGVMGILEIDKINVKLPIYHGTNAGVLQVGLGHLPGSSLPVGGKGTHAVITGHRGLPSAMLLTNLDKMKKGDTFVLYVVGEELTYRVDQIKVVAPNNVQYLGIDPTKDYCTLITCTPYGINTQRLLVRGHRIPNIPGAGWDTIHADANQLDKVMLVLIFISPVLIALLIYGLIKSKKIHKGGIVQ